ncbi:unnamed protein product [Echinostoma caproni]|uniref:Uncharacterized protein n=1 Tax=Echinostoma caproni TaxID=27848 RepID=A0A3P8LA89_9TREM|nr:unnamed protein product [Echinostoma caproni]
MPAPHRRVPKTQGATAEPSIRESELLLEDPDMATTTVQHIRDGSDPAFGKALYERLVKLEREQYETVVTLQTITGKDPTRKKLDSGTPSSTEQIKTDDTDEMRDVENVTNILSVSE